MLCCKALELVLVGTEASGKPEMVVAGTWIAKPLLVTVPLTVRHQPLVQVPTPVPPPDPLDPIEIPLMLILGLNETAVVVPFRVIEKVPALKLKEKSNASSTASMPLPIAGKALVKKS